MKSSPHCLRVVGTSTEEMKNLRADEWKKDAMQKESEKKAFQSRISREIKHLMQKSTTLQTVTRRTLNAHFIRSFLSVFCFGEQLYLSPKEIPYRSISFIESQTEIGNIFLAKSRHPRPGEPTALYYREYKPHTFMTSCFANRQIMYIDSLIDGAPRIYEIDETQLGVVRLWLSHAGTAIRLRVRNHIGFQRNEAIVHQVQDMKTQKEICSISMSLEREERLSQTFSVCLTSEGNKELHI
jgi:hypothetical protein